MKDFFNKETLDNIKQFCAENKKYVGVAGVLVGLILILIVYKRQILKPDHRQRFR